MSETAQATHEPLVMFVIYEHPQDYPRDYVCRRFFVMPGEESPVLDKRIWYIDLTLEAVRQQVPRGLAMIGRCEGDEPQIVETWL